MISIFEKSRMFFEQRLLYFTKITRTKKHFKNEQRSRDAAAKKELIQVEKGKVIIIMRISIYVPP